MESLPKRTYTLHFWLLNFSAFLFFASFNMIIPELPDYLTSLGGEDYKGLIIALFTLTAGLSRPFSGKLADHIGRKPVMAIGALVCFVCGFLYPILTSLAGFFLLRFLHGFSTGFTPTGNAAFLADVVPQNRRGEAMGILGLSNSLGMALGPAMGSEIAFYFSLDIMFYTSSAFSILSIIILLGMKESLENPQRLSAKLLKLKTSDVYEPLVAAPAVIMLLSSFSFGIILTVTPDFSKFVGMENKGTFFTLFTLGSILLRVVAGRASDRYGRIPVLRVGLVILVLSMVILGMAQTPSQLLLAGFIYGVSMGINHPTIFAWTIDRSNENHRGRAMATVYIALEVGIGTGSLISAWIYGNDPAMFLITYGTGSILALAGIAYLLKFRRKKS